MADGFNAIAHPVRRDILTLLSKRDINTGEIRNYFHISHSVLINHMDILINSGLVKRKKEKEFLIYSLNRNEVKVLIKFLDRLI